MTGEVEISQEGGGGGWLCGVVWGDGAKYGGNTVATLKTLGGVTSGTTSTWNRDN